MPRATLSVVALIPARAGSKRIPGKNVRPLAGHPLIAYTLAAAIDSGIFADIIVSTDSVEIAAISRHYGGEVPFLRPAVMAGDLSPDVEWVSHTLDALSRQGRHYDCFSLLRPTSPFRSGDTIRRAWGEFRAARDVDSLRAVERCRQHPGKMWVIDGATMSPLLRSGPSAPPWHSMPYHALPEVYVQNASLEIAWSRVVSDTGTIAGTAIMPFRTRGSEGLDVNDAEDWWYAEHLVERQEAALPPVTRPPWSVDAPRAG